MGILDRLPRYLTGRPILTFELRDGLLWVSDGSQQLAIVSEHRRNLYKRGIRWRFRRLLRHYRIGSMISVRPGDQVVNCGANIGELSIALAKLGANVTAIEPDPTTLKCLRANLKESDVQIVPVGLWDSDTSLTFYQKPEDADTSAFNQFGHPTELAVRRLDTLITSAGPIRLLVGDAEGAEPEVLRGADKILSRIAFVSFDCGPERNGQSTLEACEDILAAAGFVTARVDDRLLARNPALAKRFG
jgi:FkbM family methyltransferase